MKEKDKIDSLMYKEIDKFLTRFGRLRLSFVDYPNKEKSTWNGIYTDIDPPLAFKESLYELILFGMKLHKKYGDALCPPKKDNRR